MLQVIVPSPDFSQAAAALIKPVPSTNIMISQLSITKRLSSEYVGGRETGRYKLSQRHVRDEEMRSIKPGIEEEMRIKPGMDEAPSE